MVEILGYSAYFVHGGDWVCCTVSSVLLPITHVPQGSFIARILGVYHYSTVSAIHITLLSVFEDFDPSKTPLTELERIGLQRIQEYTASESGYAILQKTKVWKERYDFINLSMLTKAGLWLPFSC
jgi:hypothetical protein